MPKIKKEIIQKYLNFEISYEETDFAKKMENDQINLLDFIPDGNYLTFKSILHGFDLFLTREISIEEFTNWSVVACKALYVSIKNGFNDKTYFLEDWEDFLDDELCVTNIDEDILYYEVWNFRNTYIRSLIEIEEKITSNKYTKFFKKFSNKKRHNNKDIEKLLDTLNKLSELGNDSVNCDLGGFYYSGDFVEQDFEKARHYYRIAAKNGNVQALINLGYIYYYARCGGEPDYEMAFECFSKAYCIGNINERIEAGYKIFDFYFNGYFVEKDLEKCKEIIDILHHQCKMIKERKGRCVYLGDIYMRLGRLYSSKGLEDDVFKRQEYYQKAHKEIYKRWDGSWFGDANLLELCETELDDCDREIYNKFNFRR